MGIQKNNFIWVGLILFLCFLYLKNDYKDGINKNSRKIVTNQKLIHFNRNKLKINELIIFRERKSTLIKKYNLKSIKELSNFYKDTLGNFFEFRNNELIHFSIKNPKLKFKNPNIWVGMSEDVIKKLFPINYLQKTEDLINNLNLEAFEIYDENDNRLRIYLFKKRVYSVAYFEAYSY